MKPILATIIRDKPGKLIEPLRCVDFARFYSDAFVNVTNDTHPEVIRLLYNRANTMVVPPSSLSQARRLILSMAQNHYPKDYSTYFHYCDLDRLLFWISRYSGELSRVTKLQKNFVVFGRTKQAFGSHPFLQRLTEGVVNKAFYIASGKKYDVLAGSRLISHQFLGLVLDRPEVTGAGVDVQWPLIPNCNRYGDYVEVDGLGYESDYLGIRRGDKGERALRFRNMWQLLWQLLKNTN